MQTPIQITTDAQGASVVPAYTSPAMVDLTTAAYGSWLLMPGLHKPTSVRPTLSPSTLAAQGQANYESMHERLLDVMRLLGLSAYAVAKEGPVSAATMANIRAGRNQPSTELLCWLVNTYPQVNLDYLLREEGEPLTPLIAPANASARLDADELRIRIEVLRNRLQTEVYPALFDEATLLYEDGEVVTLSDRALAINLHREFVEALGPQQADWWDAYWQELGNLFEQIYGQPDQRTYLLTDRVFLQLLYPFSA